MGGGASRFEFDRVDLGCCGAMGASYGLEPLAAADCAHLGEAFARMDPWASYPYPAHGLTSYFANSEPGSPRYAIRAGATIAGVAGLRLEWLRGPYLQFLGLLPAFQGQGAGALVLDWLAREARAAGDRNLWVCASDFNGAGIRFYERHGFVRQATLDDLVRDGRAEILLRKRLDAGA